VTRFPTFLLWVIIGLIVYALTQGLIDLIKEMVEIKKESKYVHAHEGHIYMNAFKRLAARVVIVGVIIVYGMVFSNWVLPFCVYLLHVAAYALTNPSY
jgi:hypothetical protein